MDPALSGKITGRPRKSQQGANAPRKEAVGLEHGISFNCAGNAKQNIETKTGMHAHEVAPECHLFASVYGVFHPS